ncbi:hypothetical protein CUC15_17420 [Oceanobacillus zhaokaii]|uniref:Uncharacterized protein n=1 Tax=Oceanobacillus zhaokaii TaxID=2052660 RepID=A0A345PKS6_9BACI|nr:hypothetical protein CUC15_17420 [Oceanobacillus zhaokaii]
MNQDPPSIPYLALSENTMLLIIIFYHKSQHLTVHCEIISEVFSILFFDVNLKDIILRKGVLKEIETAILQDVFRQDGSFFAGKKFLT